MRTGMERSPFNGELQNAFAQIWEVMFSISTCRFDIKTIVFCFWIFAFGLLPKSRNPLDFGAAAYRTDAFSAGKKSTFSSFLEGDN